MIEGKRKAGARLMLCLMTVVLLAGIDSAQVSVALTGSVGGSSPDAMDLVIDIEGYVRDAPIVSSYSEYSEFLRSIGIPDYFADYLYTLVSPAHLKEY